MGFVLRMASVVDTLCSTLTMCVVRPGDEPKEAMAKRVLVPVACFVFILNLPVFIDTLFNDDMPKAMSIGHGIGLVSSVAAVVMARMGVGIDNAIDIVCVVWALAVMFIDIFDAALLRPRFWFFVVLLMSALLAYTRPAIIRWIIPSALIILLLERVESTSRFGLYDVLQERIPPLCHCADPPCSIPVFDAFISFMFMMLIIVLSFYISSRSHKALQREMHTTESLIKVVSEVALALAQYDIGKAETVIAVNSLPPDLVDSYEKLLDNLNSYRVYLPDALLESDDDLASPVLGAPGANSVVTGEEVDACLVFTDVQSSTVLWEAFPQGMYEALRTHNTELRSVSKTLDGYEVKVIGDALMLAFRAAEQAVSFGVAGQLRLAQSDWPPDLCTHPLCCRLDSHDGILWQGLRVRIGMNCGPVRVEKNPVTGRFDYFGSTVNVAARVEAALKRGGLTGVTESMMNELDPEFRRRPDLCIADHGIHELKGVAKPVRIFIVLPRQLAPRLQDRPSTAPQVGGAPPASPPLARAALAVVSPPSSPGESMPSRGATISATFPFSPRESTSASSTGTGRASPRMRMPRQTSRLLLGMEGSNSTFAAVRCVAKEQEEEEVVNGVSEFVYTTDFAALRSQGVVHVVISGLCVVGWNSGARCLAHVSQCGHFVGVLETRALHIGAMTGRVLAGNVQGTRKRYVTVAGPCIEVSIALAEGAVLQKTRFLAGGQIGQQLENDGRAVQCSELWHDNTGREVRVTGTTCGEGRVFATSFAAWDGGVGKPAYFIRIPDAQCLMARRRASCADKAPLGNDSPPQAVPRVVCEGGMCRLVDTPEPSPNMVCEGGICRLVDASPESSPKGGKGMICEGGVCRLEGF
eukprot:Hpha_TRINITY_DN9346_c0_g2::TRINITY_DN9346_c0_g2_i1::g.26024::m.26024